MGLICLLFIFIDGNKFGGGVFIETFSPGLLHKLIYFFPLEVFAGLLFNSRRRAIFFFFFGWRRAIFKKLLKNRLWRITFDNKPLICHTKESREHPKRRVSTSLSAEITAERHKLVSLPAQPETAKVNPLRQPRL
jgi:hypothetical protein